MPSLEDLLSKGYLPKELPNPFTSMTYASSCITRGGIPEPVASPRKWRKPVSHNLARPGMTTRPLAIPDPVHFYKLSSAVASDWATIDTKIRRSPLSVSYPVDDLSKARALVPADSPNRIEARALHCARARYAVKVDVSQFYPSIYTHALDWCIRTKEVAKAHPSAGGLGPMLDRHVREGQDGQTIGIPIGPDTSLALGELMLSEVDVDFLNDPAARGVHGFRYYDDYELFAPTRHQADAAVATIMRILGRWQLTANPYKIVVTELPMPVEEEWVSVIKRVPMRAHSSRERSDLNALFDESVRLARRFPKAPVLAYALGRFVGRDSKERRRVQKINWPHFEKLLLQAALSEPSVLRAAIHVINWASLRGCPVDLAVLAEALSAMAVDGTARGNESEVAWAIWSAISLGVSLAPEASAAIATTTDDVVALTALDANQRGLLPTLDLSNWSAMMSIDSLRGEHWLLAYEAYVHGWLPIAGGTDYILLEPAFEQLRADGVRFYDDHATLPGLAARAAPAPKPAVEYASVGTWPQTDVDEPPEPDYEWDEMERTPYE